MRQRWALFLAAGLLSLALIRVLVRRSHGDGAGTDPDSYVRVRDVAREYPSDARRWESRRCKRIWKWVDRADWAAGRQVIQPKALADCELYVVRVTEVHDEGAIFIRPPRVALAVEQVLLGEPQPEPLPAIFSESITHDLGDAVRKNPVAPGYEPIQGPELGTRFIVAGGWNDERTWFETNYENRWPVTDTKLAELAAALKEARQADPDFDTRIEAQRKEDVAAQTDRAVVDAVGRKDLARVQALLEAGARANTALGWRTALEEAVMNGDAPMIALLMRHMPRGTQEPKALMASMSDLKLFRTLLEGGISWKGWPGSTGPMNEAAGFGNCEALTLLLQAGADPNTTGRDEETVVHAATQSQQGLKCVPLLLEAGARVEVFHKGWTPLSYAARQTYSDEAERAIRALVARGARLDGETPEKETLLQAARRSPRMVELLRELGAR